MTRQVWHSQRHMRRTLVTDVSVTLMLSIIPQEGGEQALKRLLTVLATREYSKLKDKSMMNVAHASALPFKNNSFRSQIQNAATTFDRTILQMIRTCPSVHLTITGERDPSKNLKPKDLTRLILARVSCRSSTFTKMDTLSV